MCDRLHLPRIRLLFSSRLAWITCELLTEGSSQTGPLCPEFAFWKVPPDLSFVDPGARLPGSQLKNNSCEC